MQSRAVAGRRTLIVDYRRCLRFPGTDDRRTAPSRPGILAIVVTGSSTPDLASGFVRRRPARETRAAADLRSHRRTLRSVAER
jgi:hypothetical protein